MNKLEAALYYGNLTHQDAPEASHYRDLFFRYVVTIHEDNNSDLCSEAFNVMDLYGKALEREAYAEDNYIDRLNRISMQWIRYDEAEKLFMAKFDQVYNPEGHDHECYPMELLEYAYKHRRQGAVLFKQLISEAATLLAHFQKAQDRAMAAYFANEAAI